MAQGFGFIGVLEKQAHSGLRNCFSSMPMEPKDKSDLGIIESSFLSIIRIIHKEPTMFQFKGSYGSLQSTVFTFQLFKFTRSIS